MVNFPQVQGIIQRLEQEDEVDVIGLDAESEDWLFRHNYRIERPPDSSYVVVRGPYHPPPCSIHDCRLFRNKIAACNHCLRSLRDPEEDRNGSR